jgi:soluble lytic murein transglycosylase-like protein
MVLRRMVDEFDGRLDLAIAAYNAGSGAVLRYDRHIPPFAETLAYVRDVLASYDAYRARRRPPG